MKDRYHRKRRCTRTANLTESQCVDMTFRRMTPRASRVCGAKASFQGCESPLSSLSHLITPSTSTSKQQAATSHSHQSSHCLKKVIMDTSTSSPALSHITKVLTACTQPIRIGPANGAAIAAHDIAQWAAGVEHYLIRP